MKQIGTLIQTARSRVYLHFKAALNVIRIQSWNYSFHNSSPRSAGEVSHKHYLAVSLALAAGFVQLQQFQESVGFQQSLGWLPALSSNAGSDVASLGCPRFTGAPFFPTCVLLPDIPHTAGYTPTRRGLQHSRGGNRGWEIPVSSSCRQPGTAKTHAVSDGFTVQGLQRSEFQ